MRTRVMGRPNPKRTTKIREIFPDFGQSLKFYWEPEGGTCEGLSLILKSGDAQAAVHWLMLGDRK